MRRLVSAMLMLAVVPLLPRARAAEDSWDSLKQLRSGEEIEIIDMRLKNLRGAFMSVSEEAISLQVGKDEVAVPRPNVFRVAVLDPSKRSRNILLGVAIGAGAGLAGGLLIDEGVRHVSGEGGSLLFTPVLAGAGAGLGALAGLAPGYRTVYRAKRRVVHASP